MTEKYTQDDSQNAETRKKTSHSFLAVQEDTSVLEKEIKKKQMEVVLAEGEEESTKFGRWFCGLRVDLL